MEVSPAKPVARAVGGRGHVGPPPRATRREDEAGAVLILALVFFFAVSMIVISLVQMAGNNLTDTVKFKAAQSMESAANSATEVALQTMRYNFTAATLNASPPVPCWTTAPTNSLLTLNNFTVATWCSAQWNPLSAATRIVTVSTCVSSVSMTAALCAANPLLRAQATFDDYPTPIGSTNCARGSVASSTSTCGTGMTINDWAFRVVLPTVSAVVHTVSASCATQPVLVTGTGLTNATSVLFTITSGIAGNQVFAASKIVSVTDTSVVACAPTTGSGTAYVTVVTPVGASPYGPTTTY